MTCASANHLVEEAVESWESTPSHFPDFLRRYSVREQEDCEAALDHCLERLEAEMHRAARSGVEVEFALPRLTDCGAEIASCALGISNSFVDSLLREGFSAVGIQLARWARQMDPDVSMADILQACRNAWTAGALQLLFGQDLRLTPGIFAYSMLYPYSDNYLDDRSVSGREKLRFSQRFRERLEGVAAEPRGAREEIIWDLVGLIETQYSRASFPGVYDSLLAIHRAQQDSIVQLQRSGSDTEFPILQLSATKGGTSVLADAYLATGLPTLKEATFAFRWGVLLQLSDDLQDLRDDCKARSVTVFSRTVENGGPLDNLTNRAFHFSENLLSSAAGLPGGSTEMTDLLIASSRSLLTRSVARESEHYTSDYLAQIENCSPFRFQFLKSRERKFSQRRRLVERLFETLIKLEPEVKRERNDRTLTRSSRLGQYT